MKDKLILVVLIFSLTVNVAALITMGYLWGSNYRSRQELKDAGPPPFGSALSLDQEQRNRMRDLRTAFMAETAPIRDNLMEKRAELARILSSHVPERAPLEQKLREINELQLAMQIAVVDQLLEEKQFLNPQQRERYADFISRQLCRDFMPGRKGRRGHRGRREGRWMRDTMTLEK